VKIKHVARLGTGHTPSRSHPQYWEDCTIPWITTGEIQQVRDDRAEVITETRERISEVGLANSAAELRPAGTVVLCRTASAGYSAIMGAEMATSQDFATWTCSDRLLPRYLLMCLRAMRGDLLGRLAFGSTHKTIYMPDIQALQIPLPTVEEQHHVLAAIDKRTSVIDAVSNLLRHQLHLLAEHRQAMITAVVSGTESPRHVG
jgi:type I restriction enzyme S subunit